MPRFGLFVLLFGFSALSLAEPRQQTPASQKIESKLLAARATYYTPTTAGLRGFHCTVNFDWPKLFRGFGNPLPEDSPTLRYLRSVRLSVSDSLKTGGQLEWADTGTPPDSFTKGAAQMRDGLKQTLGGFLTSWNAFMNGTMVPIPDDTVTLTQTAGGYQLHTVSKEYDVTEDFDANFLLKQAHVLTDAMDVVTSPAFEQTPDGLRPSAISSTVRQPKTAAPAQSTMTLTYAPVSGFQIPSLIGVSVQNVGSFEFPLSNCTVDADKK